MNTPIFRSQADSFQVAPYWPETGLIMAPAAAYPADAALIALMQSPHPPQAVLFDLDEALNVRLPGGGTADLEENLRIVAHRAAILLRVDSEEAARSLPAFAEEQNLWDVTLCVPFDRRSLLQSLRAAMPLARGMLDGRGQAIPQDPYALVRACQRSEATMLLLEQSPGRALADSLRRRFVQLWVEGDPVDAVLGGACGLLTRQPQALYDVLSRLPACSTARPPMLFAHKGYHNTGEYPENSAIGVEAAGRLGFDAAEIDITLSSDGVPVVQHDAHTENLYTQRRVVTQTPWAELRTLRRKAFPDYGMDRFEDLMIRMKAYPETPVLIEIKTPAAEFGVEEAVRQMREILARPDVQECPTCIMGEKPPYLAYVHRRLPELPLAHCVGWKDAPESEDAAENNLHIYRFALATAGANAGYNPYHTVLNPTLLRLLHLRGITAFGWTWAFRPWEDEGEAITGSYLSGMDGLTSDWVEKFAHVPVALEAIPGQPARVLATLRDGTHVPVEDVTSISLQGRTLLSARFPLECGRHICLLAEAPSKKSPEKSVP